MTVRLHKSWLCLFFVLAAWVTETQAQLNTLMTRSTFTGTYTPITGTAATAAQADCGIVTGIPLGFSFNYLGTNYTTIALESNGWASFTATACSNANGALGTTTAPNATLAPWWDDSQPSSVQYQTTGTAGSQVFTAQWVSLSWFGSGRTINFQLKLYEGTNVIEFWYGAVSGTNTNGSTAESASIGIENTTGGPGNFIDATSGSSYIYNGTRNTGQWPAQNYRFTPAAPTAIAAGTYNVGAGQTYTTLTEAVADINHRGVAGAVTLNLTDAAYIDRTIGGSETFPIVFGPVVGTSATNTITLQGNGADLRYAGSTAGSWGNGSATGTMFATAAEPILGVCGTDFLTVNNLSLTAAFGTSAVYGTNTGSPTRVDRGLAVQNCGAANIAPVFVFANPGAQNNTFTNISITLDRNSTSTMAIDQGLSTTPSAAVGANSGNMYKNLTIKNSHKGISLGGNATWPDIGCEIGTTACTTFNTIGDPATANDMGLSTSTAAAYGIQVSNQSGVKIYNNIVRNISTSGGQTDGISVLTFQGTSEVYNNKIQTLRNTGTASTAVVSGIRASHTTTGTHSLRIYNNSVSEIISSYTGVASATRASRGIFIAGTGGLTTQTYEITNNSVSMDGSASPNISSTCFEIATTSGPVFTLRNNVFANFTGAQTGVANHMCLYSTAAASFGNTGTSSNYNDLYIANATNGFTGVGNTTTYATLANWQATMGQEANSVAADPLYGNNSSDLHSAAGALNGVGQTPPAYITTDLDCATRTAPHDIGAYNIDACSTVAGGTISPATGTRCAAQTYSMAVVGATLPSVGLTYQWEVSTTSGSGFAPVTGGSGANSASYTTGALTAGTYYYRLNVTCSTGPTTAYSNELTLVVNPQPAVMASPTSALYCNPGTAISITASGADTYSWTPATGLSATTGATVDASPTSTTTYTVTGTITATGCTNTATSAITSAPAVTMGATTATPATVCSGANSVLTTIASTGGTVNLYSFTAGTGATLDPMTGATVVVIANTDDAPNSGTTGGGTATPGQATPLPFTFTYNNSAYTHFSVSPDGWISFGTSTAAPTSDFSNQVTDLTNVPKLYPYWDDLATGTTGYARYVVTGTAPNRILKVEWFVTIPRNTGGAANSTFQAWLYETTNAIEFRYGAMGVSAMSASLGLTGSTPASQFNCITVATNTNSTTTANDANSGQPANGTIYTFNAPAISSYSWTANATPTFLVTDNTATVNVNAITATRIYTVTATNSFGCSATGTATVTAGNPLSATITNTPACNGLGFDLTAAVVGGGAPYTYSWNALDTGTPLAAAQTVTELPQVTGAYLYEVEINDACGASFTASNTIDVFDRPVASATPDTTAACGGTATSATASALTNGLAGTYTYTWSPAAGLSATNTATVSANPSIPTYYSVVVTQPSTGCKDTANVQVNVGVNVAVTSAQATPATICPGDSTVLTATAGGTGGGVVKITEVVTFRTGTGAGSYPAFIPAGPDDFIEISNISSSPIDVSGWTVGDYANNAATTSHPLFTFPTGTIIPGNAVAVIHMGTGTNDPANRYFNMGGTSGLWSSNSVYGIMLKNGATIVDVVGRGAPYVWASALGVTAADWSGNIVTTSAAGIKRIVGADNNVGSDWALSSAGNLTTMGTYDAIFFDPVGTVSYTWSPAAGLSSATGSPVTANGVAATTTYTVTATSSIGCSGTGTATVTIGGLVCTGITAAATRCGGQNFMLVASHTGGGSPYTYTWSDGVGGTYVSNDTVMANLPAGTYNFTVTVNDNCGNTCSSTLSGVVVNHSPVASVTPPAGAICSGVPANIPLTASATTNGTPGTYTYTWSPAAGLSSTTSATPTAAPTGTTLYTVSINEAATGCGITATAAIGVGTTVTMGAVTATPPAICAGGTSVLTANATVAGGTYCIPSYSTGTGSGDYCTLVQITGTTLNNSTGASAAPYYTLYPATGSTTATLTAGTTYTIVFSAGTYSSNDFAAWIDYNNDGDHLDAGEKLGQIDNQGAGPATGSFTFTVPLTANNGALRLRVREADQTALIDPCAALNFGETEDYTVTIVGGLDPMSYSWTPGASLVSSTGASVTTTAITPPTTFYVTAVSAAGCTATDSVTVTGSTPIVCSNITVPSVTCHNGNFTLVANTTGGGGTFTYSWDDGMGGTYANNDSITVNKPAGTYTFAVYISDACGSSCNMDTVITVNPLPAVAIAPTPSNALICGAGSVALAATGADTYSWTPGTGLSATTGASVTSTATTATTYIVTGTNTTTGCINSASQTVTYSPSVSMFGPVTATPATICAGATTTLAANAGYFDGYTGSVITHAPIATPGTGVTSLVTNGVATVPATYNSFGDIDDGVWASIPLPFSFSFFGNTFSSFQLGSNGWISFDAATTGVQSVYSQAIPTAAAPNNRISILHSDLNANQATSNINYFTTGTAPNRKFVVNYVDVVYYGTTTLNTAQLILNEADYSIEIHSTVIGAGSGVTMTQGIENATGTAGVATPGMNNAVQAGSTNTAYKFSLTPTPVTYSWDNGAGTGASVTVSPTDTTVYMVTASNAAGCSASANVTVTVNPLPVVTWTNALTAQCVSATTYALTGESPTGGTFSGAGVTGNNFDASVATAGSHVLTYNYTDGNGCSSSTTNSITVNSLPSVSITGLASTYCSNQSVITLTGSPTGGSFSVNGTPSATLNTATAPASNTVVYTYTDVNGCTNATAQVVGINTASNVTLAQTGGITSGSGVTTLTQACVGTTIKLKATTTGPAVTGYQWQRNGVDLSGQTNDSLLLTSGWGVYRVRITNINTCLTNADTFSISFRSLPNAQAGTDKNICEGSSVTLGVANNVNYTYSWFPTTGLSNATISNPSATPTAGPATYTVYVSQAIANSGGLVCSKSDDVVVTLKTLPTAPSIAVSSPATLVGSATPTLCEGSGTIVLTPSGTAGNTQLQWLKNGAQVTLTNNLAANLNVNNTAGVAAVYTAKVKGVNGCFSPASNAVTTTINSAALPTITPAGTNNIILLCFAGGTSATQMLTASVSSGTPTYAWYQVGTVAPVGTGSTYTATISNTATSKTFNVRATYPNACVRTSANKVVRKNTTCRVDVSGSQEVELMEGLAAYPNPTSDKLQVSITNSQAVSGTLTLTNALGQVVMKQAVELEEGKAVESFDMSKLSQGVYNLIFDTETSHEVVKVVKE